MQTHTAQPAPRRRPRPPLRTRRSLPTTTTTTTARAASAPCVAPPGPSLPLTFSAGRLETVKGRRTSTRRPSIDRPWLLARPRGVVDQRDGEHAGDEEDVAPAERGPRPLRRQREGHARCNYSEVNVQLQSPSAMKSGCSAERLSDRPRLCRRGVTRAFG